MDFGELMTVKVSVNTMVILLELSEAITMIVSAYESSMGFKKISQAFQICHLTVQVIVYLEDD